MARPLRIALAGGTYHVISRGNAQQAIFLDYADRRAFLDVVEEVLSRFRWRCLTYCLMENHYHLVVVTPRADLSRGMRHLNGLYAQRFNRRHGRCGHLFQGRFTAVLVQRDAHMLELARYVALNPVRAGICARAERWRWSAHRALLGVAQDRLVSVSELLSHFGATLAEGARSYRSFCEQGEEHPPFPEDQAIAGEPEYIAATLPARRPSAEIPDREWRIQRPPLTELLGDVDRDRAIAIAYREHGYRMREIAAAVGCHYATVSRRLRAFEGRERERLDRRSTSDV